MSRAWPRLLLAVLLLISCPPIAARAATLLSTQSAQLRLAGYVKALAVGQDTWGTLRKIDLYDQRFLFDGTLRARTGLSAFLWNRLQLELCAEGRVQSGDSQRLDYDLRHDPPFYADALPAGATALPGQGGQTANWGYFDLEDTPVDQRELRLEDRIDRLSATLYLGSLRLIAGRSTVSWGPGLIWNPTDIAAPFAPTTLDREEKIGVDMLDASLGIGNRGAIELFAAPVRKNERDYSIDFERSTLAGRVGMGLGDLDLAAVGGWIYGLGRIGLDFTWTAGEGLAYGGAVVALEREDRPAFLNAMLGYTYAFNAEINPSLRVELLHNGLGEIEPERYIELLQRPAYLEAAQRGYAAHLGRYLAAGSLSLQPHPLVGLSLTAIVNLNDGSGLAWPQITWSILENLELSAGMTLSRGPRNSEYGGLEIATGPLYGDLLLRPSDLAYAYLRWDF